MPEHPLLGSCPERGSTGGCPEKWCSNAAFFRGHVLSALAFAEAEL